MIHGLPIEASERKPRLSAGPWGASIAAIRLAWNALWRGIAQRGIQRTMKGHGFILPEGAAEVFETVDQIHDFTPGVGSAGRLAEMGPAAEGPAFIDETASGGGFEHGAGAVGAGLGESPARGSPGFRRDKGFRLGEIGGLACQFEAAARGLGRAIPLDRAVFQLCVDGFHLLVDVDGSGFRHGKRGESIAQVVPVGKREKWTAWNRSCYS